MYLTALLFMVFAQSVAAISIGCQDVWAGPSSSNDIVACLLNRVKAPAFMGNFAATFIFLALAILLILIFLPFFVIRQCCNGCGASVMRPTTFCYGGEEWDDRQEEAARQYSKGSVTCIRVVAVLVFLLSFISLGLIIAAATTLEVTVREILSDVFNGFLSLIDNTIGNLKSVLLRNGTFIVPGLSNATFNVTQDITDSVNSLQTQVNGLVFSNLHIVSIVLIVISVISSVTALLTLIVMMCSIRRCLPALCTCWNFLFGVLFSLLTAILFLISILLLFIDGEVKLAAQQKPGVLQWYVVPLCDGVNPIAQLTGTADNALINVSQQACTKMLDSCDNSTVYNVGTPEIAFVCNLTTATVNTTCTSPEAVRDLLSSSVAKAPVCDGCTMATCPTQCNQTAIANATQQAVDAVNKAVDVKEAVGRVDAFASCHTLLLTLLNGIRLNRVTAFFFFISAGLGWAALTFMFLICLNFKGQKLFLSSDEMSLVPSSEVPMSAK